MNGGINCFFLLSLFVGMSLLHVQQGCYEPIEGCLDSNASNFDFSADNDCEACCKYSSLTVNFQHEYAKDDLQLNFVYTNNKDSRFRILDASFFISDVGLINDIDERQSISDSMQISCLRNGTRIEQSYSNTVKQIKPNITSVSFSNWRSSGSFTQFFLTVGLDECLNQLDTSMLESTASIFPYVNDQHYIENKGFITHEFTILPETTPADTLTFSFSGLELSEAYDFSVDLSNTRGSGLSVSMIVDYWNWFKDIDFATDDEGTILSVLSRNMKDVFRVD